MADRPSNNWSLEPAPWQILEKELSTEQLSWSRADFHHMAAPGVSDEPGIYLICAASACALGPLDYPLLLNILYVGKADRSIRERFQAHLGRRAKAPMLAARRVFGSHLSFYFAATSRPTELEKLFYDAFGPIINAVSPPTILKGHLGAARTAGRTQA